MTNVNKRTRTLNITNNRPRGIVHEFNAHLRDASAGACKTPPLHQYTEYGELPPLVRRAAVGERGEVEEVEGIRWGGEEGEGR